MSCCLTALLFLRTITRGSIISKNSDELSQCERTSYVTTARLYVPFLGTSRDSETSRLPRHTIPWNIFEEMQDLKDLIYLAFKK